MIEEHEDFRSEMQNKLQNSVFPLENPMELSKNLPNGRNTTFTFNGKTLTAQQIIVTYSKDLNYPYESQIEFIQDLVKLLKKDY